MESSPQTQHHPDPESEGSAVTTRAVVLGLVTALAINLWISIAEYVIHASRMQLAHFPFALFAALLLIALANGIFRRLAPRYALREAELLTILAVGFVGAVIPTSGITGFLMGILASVYYFATPENQWATYLHPTMPGWAVPSNEHGAMTWFYEGLPAGQVVPYRAWLGPLFWWMLFLLALGGVCFCISVILRRQWVRNERLLYPLASVGATLTQETPNRILPASLRGGLFWLGFAVSFGVIGWNILNYFWPVIPKLPWGIRWSVFVKGYPRFNTGINFYTAGFAYFANLSILFSIWFCFIVFFWIENGILNRIGYAITPNPTNFDAETAVAAWQGYGALALLVFWNLWMARSHIRAVFATAFGRGDADDADELVSYRAAVFGLIGCLTFVCAFFTQLGMQGKLIAILVPAMLVNYLAIARIVSETGLAYLRTTSCEQYIALFTLGTRGLAPSSMTGISLTYSLISQGKGVFMPPFAHVVKVADLIRRNRRRIVPALFLVILLGIAADFLVTVNLGYQTGAFNFRAWPFSSAGRFACDLTASQMRSPFDTSWERLVVFCLGAGVMAFLTLLHYRFPRWPLHPIGFPIASTWTAQLAFPSIFIVWGIKAILLKVGGVSLYRKFQPFFLGILVGYALGVTLSFVVDAIWFPGRGHTIHGW
ncbi:MAG: hypothetical protein QGI83_03840 [Candidatus Latescibacteria bacterium]|nr:hypothetical protein [Candidatus Latescibacterota bacterium]